ncbi:MAG TPA: hypothetical protein VLJ39_21130 [Tepidisphaeraceae bacterium]|jgi:hypothetical protein|nr:hypothetical protein [Tepidisphaeraceae bacterium]
MTTASLLDAVTRDDSSPAMRARLAGLAGRVVEGLLARRELILRIEQEFLPSEWADPAAGMELERSIYSLHRQWASEAEEVLQRVRRLVALGASVKDFEAIENAYASTIARLKLTPERTARGLTQAAQGEFTPAQDLRDELRARIRA